MTRREILDDSEKMNSNSEDDWWPPWMEPGNIRECRRCGHQVWEFIALPDECISCHAGTAFITNRTPTRWERIVHWWKVDKRFTPADAAKQDERIRAAEDALVGETEDEAGTKAN